jgi:Ca2+-binding RTX toxin-like protein
MATIFFPSNNDSVQGTPGADSMIGNDPSGNINDIVYGKQGDDTIVSQHGLFDSTIYGGQGDDSLTDIPKLGATHQISGNVIYGNFGNDVIGTRDSAGDVFYGGQGDDSLFAVDSTATVIYGNLGNDIIYGSSNVSSKSYGGHGDDTIKSRFEGSLAGTQVIYGNFGNDVLVGSEVDNEVMYGGQGNDFLRFTGQNPNGTVFTTGGVTKNDVEFGNLGNDTFAADNGNRTSFGGAISVNEIVTVADFVQGEDKLTETSADGVPTVKLARAGADATDALTAANQFYAGHTTPQYVFVYGGTAAGFLFYNGSPVDGNEGHATAGMAILGATGEMSVNVTDIIPRTNNTV